VLTRTFHSQARGTVRRQTWAFAVAAMSAVLAMVAWGIVIRQVAPVPWPEVLTPASAPAGAV
jgi:hypothetical protein